MQCHFAKLICIKVWHTEPMPIYPLAIHQLKFAKQIQYLDDGLLGLCQQNTPACINYWSNHSPLQLGCGPLVS